VRYLADRDLLEIETTREEVFLIPRAWIGALQDVPADELTRLAVWPDGSAIELDERNIHISVDGLLTNVLRIDRIVPVSSRFDGARARQCVTMLHPRARRDYDHPLMGGARQVRMVNGKIGYYADFIIYTVLLLALVAFTLRGSRSDQLIWLGVAIAGAAGWTLVEYALHRFVFHRVPIIADLHHAHHASPRAYLSTPTWLTLLILGVLFFLPIWRLFTLNIAFGAISGLILGWLWYGIMHHVIHHRRPRRLAIALKAASHRHFRHHSDGSGNFGVTTPVWDYVFGTHISSRARIRDVA